MGAECYGIKNRTRRASKRISLGVFPSPNSESHLIVTSLGLITLSDGKHSQPPTMNSELTRAALGCPRVVESAFSCGKAHHARVTQGQATRRGCEYLVVPVPDGYQGSQNG